jgi:hypothetical protein
MKKQFKSNNFNEEAKVQQLKLTHQKNKSSALSTSNSSSNSSNFGNKISKTSQGIKVNNSTVIINTRYEESGRFNKNLKDKDNPKGQKASNKDIGNRVKSALKYQDREAEQEHEKELEIGESLDKNMSHSYDLDKRLSKEDIKEITNELDKGVAAMRTSVISTKQENNLSKQEDLAIVQKAITEHNAKYNKNVRTIITQHNDTNNRHHHVLQFGSKDDIKMSDTQLEDLKLRVATLTKEKLEEKGLSHKLDKEIDLILDKQEKLLRIEEKLDKHVENLKELNNNRLKEIDKATDRIVDRFNFSQEQLDSIKAFEKANGYKQFLEKQDNPDPAKLQKADQWKQDVLNKMDDITKDKHTQLKVEIDKFNNSKEFEDINNKFKQEAKEATLKVSQELKDISKEYKPHVFKKGDAQYSNTVEKTAKKMEYQAANFDNKKFKNVSLDSVLNKAEALSRESKDEAIQEIVKDVKNISKDATKENNASYNNEQKGGLFLEHDKVSKDDTNEIQNTLKGLEEKRSSSKIMSEVVKHVEMKDKLESAQSERFKHSKNQQSAEFRAAQTKFFNAQAVLRDGVDLNKIDNYVDYAVKSGKMTQENGDRFKSNAKVHANELTKAGILNKESDTEFKFTDEKSRELLYDNHDKSIKEISKINKDDLKSFKKEMDVYKKTKSTKDLKRLQQEVKNKQTKEKQIKEKIDLHNKLFK